MKPVVERCAANREESRSPGTRSLAEDAGALERAVVPVGAVLPVLERRADVAVLDLDQEVAERSDAEVHALEEHLAVRGRRAPERVADAHAHPRRRLELVAQARDLEALGATAAEAAADGHRRREVESRRIEPRGGT